MATHIFDPIASRKKAQKVIVTCYGQRKEYATASKAINFFTLAVNGCDPQSSECGRYQRILTRLYAGQRIVSDED
jgi:hypothetical protein